MVEDDNNVNRLRHRNARNVKLNLGNARCLEVVSAGLARGGLTDSDRTLVRIFGVILRWRGIGVGICIKGCSDASCNGFARRIGTGNGHGDGCKALNARIGDKTLVVNRSNVGVVGFPGNGCVLETGNVRKKSFRHSGINVIAVLKNIGDILASAVCINMNFGYKAVKFRACQLTVNINRIIVIRCQSVIVFGGIGIIGQPVSFGP